MVCISLQCHATDMSVWHMRKGLQFFMSQLVFSTIAAAYNLSVQNYPPQEMQGEIFLILLILTFETS